MLSVTTKYRNCTQIYKYHSIKLFTATNDGISRIKKHTLDEDSDTSLHSSVENLETLTQSWSEEYVMCISMWLKVQYLAQYIHKPTTHASWHTTLSSQLSSGNATLHQHYINVLLVRYIGHCCWWWLPLN